MRILIHGINFSPELTGVGKYTGEMAEWLSSRGHEVRVVTAPPYYPQWRIADGFANRWGRAAGNINPAIDRPGDPVEPIGAPAMPGQSGGGQAQGKTACSGRDGSLLVYRCPLWVPSKPSGLKRILHLISFALSSLPVMLRQIFWRPEVVWIVEPTLFCAPQAWLVARLSGGKTWLHVSDYEVDAAFDLGLLKGATLHSFVGACERWLMRRFDRVSTVSQRMLDRALAKGVAKDRAFLFPNWININSIVSKPPEGAAHVRKQGELCDYRSDLGIAADAVVALYSGNMGGKQGLEALAQVAALLRDIDSLVFVFCGNGAGRDELVAQCDGLQNVRFLDLQPLARLGELLCMADIHLLPQRADVADLVMPSKLIGMLASGRPVVATSHVGTELASVVEGRGLVVQPEQPQAFADAINALSQDAMLRVKLGAAGRAYAEAKLDRDAVLGSFEAELVRLTTMEGALSSNSAR